MKIVLSALVVALALSQTAEAKTKILATETKTSTEKARPLDGTATGGIVPLAGAMTKEPGRAYPPPLDLHF
ncbi:hypothetical protein [Mesorhizobium sp. WSM4884]|uniref:hypothetical protein n=1 Tax=Mesorhizobium sp. WSM4884 TaxID=3038542 RepID=UPI0024180F41|nr:hypothetical protein [Mesorhizobium sp. WSM4884]MDG4882880.1 hypothetical protein [Mesorhizobium sp. WSM4884]